MWRVTFTPPLILPVEKVLGRSQLLFMEIGIVFVGRQNEKGILDVGSELLKSHVLVHTWLGAIVD